jgi:[ribosomal protein S18]-alanine N-acetyltransferase
MVENKTIRIVEAAFGDLDRILELEHKGFVPGNRECREVYARRIEVFPQGALMAYVDSVCVGCFFSEIWREETLNSVDSFQLGHDIGDRHDSIRGKGLYVSSITVDPDYRGNGLGADLFAACIDRVCREFPAISSVNLLVSESWTHARRIYRKLGFAEIARLRGFFKSADSGADDGIVMGKSLDRLGDALAA